MAGTLSGTPTARSSRCEIFTRPRGVHSSNPGRIADEQGAEQADDGPDQHLKALEFPIPPILESKPTTSTNGARRPCDPSTVALHADSDVKRRRRLLYAAGGEDMIGASCVSGELESSATLASSMSATRLSAVIIFSGSAAPFS